ncbi:aldo/keto reductase [Wenxinia marina]|uniref:Putative oxidoreductase n=1 Tax=Wenxinia marina DSM 24838 TaxID=1123501 RepID=A0A0D0Q4W5_9RHOB|nr:aldo/keto reductase [Wenxinia marina]KIQ67572.1 putative oxidoreductase [Wenxinia marina DSM 24838]GGL68386.1 aldo/keto reductase [Wenxinia marina]
MTLTLASGRPASRFAFGTMQWGAGASEDEARRMYDACRAAGIDHFDTAVGYTEGRSEEILGRIARGDRDQLYVATKIGYDGDGSRDALLAHWDRSRRQLDLDSVDLLYLHRFHAETPLEAQFEVLARLQSDGAIRHIGVSNYAAWQVMKAQAVAASLGTRIDAIQPMYNLVKRQAEVEILPMAADQGLAALPYSPLGGGLLTGKYARGEGGRLAENAMYGRRYAPDWMHAAAKGLSDIAAEVGTDPATLAVAWVAAHAAGPMPIVSGRSTEQLQPSLAALSFEMDADLYARLCALTPTPPPATDRLEEQA